MLDTGSGLRRAVSVPATWNGLAVASEVARPGTGPALQVLTAERAPWPAGRVALMVHSLTSHAHSWLPVISRMAAGRFVCPDLRGHGFSDWARDGYWLADYARDLAGLCAMLPVAEIDLIAPSLGARVAMLLAPQLGRRLRSLVLLDGAPSISATAAAKVGAIRSTTTNRTAFRDEPDVTSFWAATHPDWDAEALAVRARYMYRRNWAGLLVSVNDPETAFLFGRAASVEQDDVWAALRGTTAPVTVVRARDSYFTDEATARQMAAAAPAGRFRSVDGGHYLVYESPVRLAALLDELLTLLTLILLGRMLCESVKQIP
jgi:pimeloyl-ACP methyl ester carboxylesterase